MLLRPHKLRPTRRAVLAGMALLLGPALGAHALFSHSLLNRAHVLRPAGGATDVVTSAADNGSAGTLRSVLAAANSGDTITFDPGVFGTANTITLNGTELATAQNVTIQGPGANKLTIDAGGNSRVFDFTSSAATDALSGLTVADGNDGGQGGGGVYSSAALSVTDCVFTGNMATSNDGGGIDSYGSLTVTGCAFTGNASSNGGGLCGFSTLTVTGSVFSGDTAGQGSGGGVFIAQTGAFTNCTFANDTAANGGGIVDEGTTPITVTSCTFSGDTATSSGNGGGIYEDGGGLTATSSLFTGSSSGDIVNGNGTTTSGGSNLLGDASPSAFSAAGANDQFGVSNAMIGALANNGGPTQTCAVLAGSPAIGGDYANPTATDQRGYARTATQHTIGAYDYGASAPLVSLAVTPASPSINVNGTQQFTATATYSDNSTANVTSTATWASDNAAATINASGLATGVAPGTANITAAMSGVTSLADALTVGAPGATSITVTAASASVAAGLTDSFTATENLSDGSTQDVTSQVTWDNDDYSVAGFDNGDNVLYTYAQGTTGVTATLNGLASNSYLVTVTAPVLVGVSVNEASDAVAPGGTDQFAATENFSDGSSAPAAGPLTWASDATGVATVDSTGLATGVAEGTANVTAAENGFTSPPVALRVHTPTGRVVTNALDDGSAGSLRAVLALAGPGDTVTFDPGVFGTTPQAITLTQGVLSFAFGVTIQGPGANLMTVDANHASAVFSFSSDPASVSGLTVANGNAGNGDGGGISGNSLTLTACAFVDDSAGRGGGVYCPGPLTVTGCTFLGDSASGGYGGGIDARGAAVITNSTFSGNSAPGGYGGGIDGEYGAFTLTSCTFTGNSSSGGGSLYLAGGGAATITACLFAGSTGGDIYSYRTITSGGSNVLGDGDGSGFANGVSHDQTGVSNAMIGALASNGGPTQTCAVLAGSPAIGGDYNNATATDQRGYARTAAQHTIGAYEYAAPAAPAIAHTLWNSADGQVQVRAVNSDGTETTLGTFGPYTDSTDAGVAGNTATWVATALATAPDGTLRLLWNNPDGRVMLWHLDAQGVFTVAGYGPYDDTPNVGVPGNTGIWRAVGLSVGADGLTHLLWDNPDGRAMLWDVASDDSFTVLAGYGPYTDGTDAGVAGNGDVWHATGLATAPDGSLRLLWNHPDGRVMLWDVDAQGNRLSLAGYGPYDDSTDAGVAGNTGLWRAVAVQVSGDGHAHLLWDHPDGRSMLWDVDGSYGFALAGYGPYTDAPISPALWRALGLALTPSGLPYVLWGNPDGRTVLWNVGADASVNYSGIFEATQDGASHPWLPTALSAR